MAKHPRPYTRLGAGLVVGGGLFAPVSWVLVGSIPLVALGMSAVLLGVVALALGHSIPTVPPEASRVLLRTGLENLSALLEEVGLSTPAVYLPSRLASGRPAALIPLHGNPGPRIEKDLPRRLIVRFGPEPQDMGILVTTAGTAVMDLLSPFAGEADRPAPTSGEMESAIGAAVVGHLDLADRVHVHRQGGALRVEIANPRLEHTDLWITRSIGSPLASIVATIVAEGLRSPVRITQEQWESRSAVVVVEPVDAAV
jgi:hypothetical protein